MNHTKTTLIQNSLNLLGDNPNHTFFAITIRPYEDFLRRLTSPHRAVQFEC